MVRQESCPDEADLDAFIRGALTGPALAAVESHIAGCADCRQIVALVTTAPPAPETTALLASRFVALGRYLILEVLGAGAMGVVYRAYDPDLDRKIALKLVNAGGTGDSGGASRDRLLREAKAMARVKHPNVVGVFDAGMHDEQVYIAMELVEGTSLTRWLAEEPHTADEIVLRFVAAGRGLAAAHAAGLVHRDFKPDNVLVGRDGQVSVTDFGLAQADSVAPAAGPDADARPTSVTRSGTIAGTPAYMAPEQLRGERADARSDQFAFCVALCEGLTGKRPYAGRTLDELRAAMLHAPELPAGVPPRIRRALTRGLSADPALRFASMDPLLAELTSWLRRRTRIAVTVAAVAVAVLLAIGVGVQARQACGVVAANEAEGLWTPRREAVRAAFDASGSPVAASTFEGLERVVGGHLEDYRVAKVAICEARAVADDSRVACLAERRRDLGALIDVLAGADAAVVRDAVLAAHAIRPIGLCGHLESAAGALAPTSPEAVAVAEALSHAGALRDAGQFEPGLTLAQDTLAPAEALPDPRFGFRARLLEGELLAAAGRYDEAAVELDALYFDASAGRDDETAARAVLQLARVHGDYLRHGEHGLLWSRHADVAIRRLDDVPLLRAQWHFLQGIIANNEVRSDDAIGHFEEALAIDTEVLGADHIQVATDLAGLGSAYAMAGRFDEALVRQKEALAATEAALGPDHPRVVLRLINVAITLGRSGHGGDGVPYLERALPVARTTLGPEHPTTLMTVGVLGTLYLEVEDVSRGRQVLEEGAAVVVEKDLWNPNLEHLFLNLALAQTSEGRYEDALQSLSWGRRCVPEGTVNPQTDAHRLLIEAMIRLGQGQPEKALALAREARAIALSLDDDILLGDSGLNMGRSLVALGRFDEAARELDAAYEATTRAYGADTGPVALALVARAQAELGRGGAAAPWFEEAVGVAERAGAIEALGDAWFGLAKTTPDPARAIAAAEHARDTYARRDFLASQEALVETWLARRLHP